MKKHSSKKQFFGMLICIGIIAVGVAITAHAQEKYNNSDQNTEKYRRGGLLGGGGFLGTGIGHEKHDYRSDEPGLIGGVGEAVKGTGNTAANIVTFGAVSREERREARRREREERRRRRNQTYQERRNTYRRK